MRIPLPNRSARAGAWDRHRASAMVDRPIHLVLRDDFSARASDGDDVDRPREAILPLSEGLAQLSLHAVPFHGAADLFGDDHAEPRAFFIGGLTREPQKKKMARGNPRASFLNAYVVRAPANPPCTRIRLVHLLLEDARRETRAALAAAVVDDLAAAGGRHARAETVRAGAARVVRLVRAFHGAAEISTTRRPRQR